MSTFARLCRSAVALFWAAIPLAAPAQGTHRVPQDFPTIQAAINASSTGDTVLVAPGTYFENLTVQQKELKLLSSGGAAQTILDGRQLGPVFYLLNTNSVTTTISGFTIQNGATTPLTGGRGAGIDLSEASATITNNIFRQNLGDSIYAFYGMVVVTGNSISTGATGPAGDCYGGTGVAVFGAGSARTPTGKDFPNTIVANTIFGQGNQCFSGGIDLVTDNSNSSQLIQNNTIRNTNLAISANSNDGLIIAQNLIFDNTGGAIRLGGYAFANTDPAQIFIVNNTLRNNLNGVAAAEIQSEIYIQGSAAQTALLNNILVGTTTHPVLTCEAGYTTYNTTPLLLDHNDLYNTTLVPGSLISGDCGPGTAGLITANGNLSLDPGLVSATDLHLSAGSPAVDAGTNSAPFLPLQDFSGNARILDSTGRAFPTVDLGAYETAGSSDAVVGLLSLTSNTYQTPPASITLTAQATLLTGEPSSGNVTFFQNGVKLSTVSAGQNGIASLGVPLLSGVYGFTASLAPVGLLVAPTTSPILYVDVTGPTPPTTILTLAATPATQTLNQPITLTLHLGSTTSPGSTTPGPVPPGAVTLSEGSTLLSTLQPDATGLATYTIPKPGLGSHTYTVTYAGTTLYPAAAATTSISITAPVATSLTATATPNPAPLNTPVSCSAHVVAASGPAPTGTVTFTDGATPVGSVALTATQAGLANLVLPNLTFGLHTIAVTFTGDPGFSSSTGTCTVNVGGDATATILSSSKNPAATTDTVTYTASVTNTGTPGAANAPAGSISLSEGNTLLASAPLVPGPGGSGIATLPATLTLPGLHVLTATYLPATAATFTSSATLTESITAPPPITTALSATPNPVTFGQLTTLAATVTSAAVIPTPASVTFTDGATILGTVALPATGPATLPVRTLSVGTHQIGAVLHTSDTSAIRSTATPLTLQVNGLPDTLTLAVSPAATAFATAPVTLSATLAPTADLPAGSTLAGAITFLDGTVPLGTATFAGDGRATFTTTTLTPGGHTLTASFGGNLLLASATSAALTEQISANPTATTLSVSPSATTAFAPVTLSARVTSSTSSASLNTLVCTPACAPVTVTFFATSATGLSTLGIVPIDANGNATLSLNPAAVTESLTAAFSGSPLFAPSSSAPAPLSIAVAPTALTLTANPGPVYQHGTVTLTAALTAPGVPASALAGTVTFLEGATPLGTTSLAAAQAFAYSPGTVGPHTLSAVFSGSGNLTGASATVTVTVLPSDFVLSLKDTALTIATTRHAPTTITISTTGSLADQIDLSCANLPAFATCTFAPATHDLTQTTTSTGTLMVDTDALLNYAGAHTPPLPLRQLLHQTGAVLALCLPLGLVASRRRRRSPSSALGARLPHLLAGLLLSIAAAASLTGCSGLYPSHVAPGTYTVTVIGHARTSGVEHSTTLTLVVTR